MGLLGGRGQLQETDPWPARLFGLFLFALLLRLASFTGVIGSDDLSYSVLAEEIVDGTYAPIRHHFAVRYGLILPVGLIYAVAGVSEWSTIALPLLASSLSVVLLALIGARLFGPQVGVIAGLLYATFPIELRYATVLLPESVAVCYVLLAVLVHVRTEERAPLALGALAGACVGLAYLTKEPAVLVAPAIFLDALLRRRWQQAIGIALGVGAVIAVEHAYYLLTTGDLLFRFRSVARHNQRIAPTVEVSADLVFRLFRAYPEMMLRPSWDFGAHSLMALILSGAASWRFRRDSRTYFILMWATLPWLYLNFGSSSLAQYIVIPVAPRYIVFAYAPLFLLAAWLLADLMSRDFRASRVAVPLVAALLLVGAVCGLATRASGYRTDQVAVLRSIAYKVKQEALGCVSIDLGSDERSLMQGKLWLDTLRILSGGKIMQCDGKSDGAVIRQDRVGFPYVASRRQ